MTTTDVLKKLNFVQGDDFEIYAEDGTKLTIKSETQPTEYQKVDGTIIFAADIIASHYQLDKTDENIQKNLHFI